MIQITTNLWVGDSSDEARCKGITAILNVAVDLPRTTFKVLYAQCGLVDGPGNRLNAYRAAILMLMSLLEDNHKVLVCCHSGSRALAVCIMFMHQMTGQSWEQLVELLSERYYFLPEIHEAHYIAYKEISCKS